MFLKMAWRNIWRNKRRSLITAASVSFALFFAIVLRSLQLGTYERAYAGVINSTTGYLQVHQKGYWEQQTLEYSLVLTDSLHQKLQQEEGVVDYLPRLESFSLLSGPAGETKGGLVRGLQPQSEQQYFQVKDRLYAGRLFNAQERAVVLGKRLAEYLDLGINDTLVMIGQGYHGVSANGKYPVCGIVDLMNPEMNRQVVLMPLAEAQYLYGAEQRATSLVVIPRHENKLANLKQSLQSQLDTARFEIMTWREMMPELVQAIEADSAGGLIILFILYLVIGFGVFGTILMLTAERLPEFGILISIGMSRHRVALVTFMETLFLALLGLAAGALLALPISWYFHLNPIRLTGDLTKAMEEYGFEPIIPFSVDPSIWFVHGTGVLIVSIILSLYAIIKIYQLKPVEATRT